MRVLFVMKQRNYLATYAGVVSALLRRGHAVRLAWPDEDVSIPEELTPSPLLSIETWEHKRGDVWAPLAGTVRRGVDYLRYLEPSYRDAVKLRARAFEKLLHSLSKGEREAAAGWSETGLALTAAERQRLETIGRLMEEAIPSDPRQEAFLASFAPDVVLVSPLIDLGSAQSDVVKSARRLGIPSAMVLFSWDNLSTKGGLHVPPDRMFVWNELQRDEAVRLHGYPREQTVPTGAPRFDEFFALHPQIDRESFCAPIGFDPAKPILMYLGSSKFVVTSSELPFIRTWLTALRRSADPLLRGCNVLIRPHPDVKPSDDEGPAESVRWHGQPVKAVVTRPIDDPRVAVVRTNYRKAQGFRDALHHSAAVVALNTSAALEAAIAGRPVFTLPAGDDAADGQTSTLHFHYLLEEHGGCVSYAVSLDDHLAQLAGALRDPQRSARLREFAQSFLRPAGWTVAASEVLAAAIEREFDRAPAARGEATGQPTDAGAGRAREAGSSDPAVTSRS